MNINLVLLKKNGLQKAFSLPSSVTVIGRRHDCDFCIPLMSVSRRHCQLSFDGKTLKIRDLGSHNGTILNGQRVDESVVNAGDALKIGPLAFIFQIDDKPESIVHPDRSSENIPRKSKPIEDTAERTAGEQAYELSDSSDSDSLLDDFVEGADDSERPKQDFDSLVDDLYDSGDEN